MTTPLFMTGFRNHQPTNNQCLLVVDTSGDSLFHTPTVTRIMISGNKLIRAQNGDFLIALVLAGNEEPAAAAHTNCFGMRSMKGRYAQWNYGLFQVCN